MRCVLCALVSLSGTGCISLLGPEDLRLTISLSQGVGLDREFAIGVDGLTLTLVSALARSPWPIDGVTWADVGVYSVKRPAADKGRPFISRISLPGWEPIIRVRDDDGEAAVLVKSSGSAIRGIVVLARDGEELVIVRVKGWITKLLERYLDSGTFAKKGWPGLVGIAADSPPHTAGD